jgi:CDP-2,3-bis-(O-geranylgeranyl)-sn-glycerol synthase
MLNDLLFVLWFFLPVGVANVIPILIAKTNMLQSLAYPIDFKKTYKGKRIFGDHKTIRGFVVGILAAICTVFIQQYVYMQSDVVRQFVPIDYTQLSPILFGLLAALGALVGDAAKSFFKRQINIKPGKTWFPFDQIDYIIGGIIFTCLYIPLGIWQYILLFIVWFLIHILSTRIGYILTLKKSPL